MSRPKPESSIFDAASQDDHPNPAQSSGAIKRRSSRVTIDIPVEVYGQGSDGKLFHEETRTQVVNAHGALVLLKTEVRVKQVLLVINKKTRRETQCRVAYRKELQKGRAEVGMEFLDPSPGFWGVGFPPEDWNRAERKRAFSPPA